MPKFKFKDFYEYSIDFTIDAENEEDAIDEAKDFAHPEANIGHTHLSTFLEVDFDLIEV